LYGNGRGFEKKTLKNKICSEMYEVFDFNVAFVNVVDKK
jgi:hypothetical protein